MAGRREAKEQVIQGASALPDMAGLDSSIGFLLRMAQVAVFNDMIATMKPYDLRPTDFSALMIVGANPGLRQQALGEALRIKRPRTWWF